MALSVKVFFERPLGKNQEIRRFSVNYAITIATLKEKIVSVYPDLSRPEDVKMFWKDDEGDLIALTSQEELTQALKFMENDLLKVYIKECRKPCTGADASLGPHHPGVVCDGCDGAIFGDRHKCSICPDYDLCSQCLEKGIHPEHPKIRIRSPADLRYRHGFGGPWSGEPHVDCPVSPPEDVNSPHMQHYLRRHWLCWRQRFGGQQQEGQQGERRNQETDGQQREQGPQQYNVGEEYLRTMGETVAAMLDPLGIDVTIDIETPAGLQRINPTTRQSTSQASQAGTSRVPESSQAPDVMDMDTAAETGEISRQTGNLMDYIVPTESSPSRSEDSDWMFLNHAELVDEGIEDKIEKSLRQMTEMGFDNDDGWLRSLLQDKGGDIAAVLDTIKHRTA